MVLLSKLSSGFITVIVWILGFCAAVYFCCLIIYTIAYIYFQIKLHGFKLDEWDYDEYNNKINGIK